MEKKKSKIAVDQVNWISKKIKNNTNCEAKIKSDQEQVSGKLIFSNNNKVEFEFDYPQISIAPGQACVFYQGDEVLGGGWINKQKN